MRRIRLKTAAVTGSIDCALRLALRFIPPPFLRRGGGRVCLLLRLQTIFDGFVPALRRHPSFVGVLARFTPLSTRNLRLLFRPGRTGIFTPASNRRTAAIRHHPPTHKRTDERTEICPWHSLISRPVGQRGFVAEGRNVGGLHYRPHPERGLCNGI